MKITFEHYDSKYSMELSEEILLSELLMELDRMLKLVGYCYEGELDIVMEDKSN